MSFRVVKSISVMASLLLLIAEGTREVNAFDEIKSQLRAAENTRDNLAQRLKIADRDVELLTQMRQLYRQLGDFDRQMEEAEADDNEDLIEQLKMQMEEAEFEIERLEFRREILEQRDGLLRLLGDIPAESEALQKEGQRLLVLIQRVEQLVGRSLHASRRESDEEAVELEEQIGEVERSFELGREIIGLKVELLHAKEEGEEEWIQELRRELQELEGENERHGKPIDGKQSSTKIEHPSAMKIDPEELVAAGRLDLDTEIIPLLKSVCFDCHNTESTSGDLNLEAIVAIRPLVKNRNHWLNVIQQIKVRSMPPMDAEQPTETERRTLAAWLSNAIENFPYDSVRQPGFEPARRLTHEEYNHTVRDLFGVDVRPADRFPADLAATSGFDNSSSSLFLQPVLLERYLGAAEYVVDVAFPENDVIDSDQPVGWSGLLGDQRLSQVDGAKKIVARLISRAYRRPVSDAEVTALVGYFEERVKSGRSRKAAMKDVIRVVLSSPGFLIRSEQSGGESGQPFRITDWEIASRLSYFLWASMPDEELFSLARAGRLREAEVLRSQTQRMLDDPRSTTLGTVFASQWLGFGALKRVPRSPIDNPWQTDSLIAAMQKESAMFFHALMVQNEQLDRLIDADYTFVNEELARHYGMSGVRGDEFRLVALTDSPRRGLLGHGSILAVTSFPGRTSPVVRGNWILSELLGTPPPPPPPNVSEFNERVARNERLTPRQKLVMHRDNPNCYACHSQIDPLGFALEEFGWFGRHRTKRRGKQIDASGQLPGGEKFSGLNGLCNALLAERMDDLTLQVTRKMFSYALGRQLEYYDEAVVRDVVHELEMDKRRMRMLVHAIVQSDTFLMKQE